MYACMHVCMYVCMYVCMLHVCIWCMNSSPLKVGPLPPTYYIYIMLSLRLNFSQWNDDDDEEEESSFYHKGGAINQLYVRSWLWRAPQI